jgi:hypothetical protein
MSVATQGEVEAMVTRFLHLMEDRDLAAAEAMMAPEARITFPGGKVFASQSEMVEASRGRYQWVRKRFEQIDSFDQDDCQIVYVSGTLYGVNRHGIPFSGVRYVDRFAIRDNLIEQQDVWNDLAESGVLEQTAEVVEEEVR